MIAKTHFLQALLTSHAFKMKLKYLSFRKTFAAVQIFQQFFPSITGARAGHDVLLRQKKLGEAVFWHSSLVIQVVTSFFRPYFTLHLNSIRKSPNNLILGIISRVYARAKKLFTSTQRFHRAYSRRQCTHVRIWDTATCWHSSTIHHCFCIAGKCTRKTLPRSSAVVFLAFPVGR